MPAASCLKCCQELVPINKPSSHRVPAQDEEKLKIWFGFQLEKVNDRNRFIYPSTHKNEDSANLEKEKVNQPHKNYTQEGD